MKKCSTKIRRVRAPRRKPLLRLSAEISRSLQQVRALNRIISLTLADDSISSSERLRRLDRAFSLLKLYSNWLYSNFRSTYF